MTPPELATLLAAFRSLKLAAEYAAEVGEEQGLVDAMRVAERAGVAKLAPEFCAA